ncbi:MAG: hypothetical protein U0893_08470 [Chloroflexota bacterium]
MNGINWRSVGAVATGALCASLWVVEPVFGVAAVVALALGALGVVIYRFETFLALSAPKRGPRGRVIAMGAVVSRLSTGRRPHCRAAIEQPGRPSIA